jgi:hypothetical protein
VKAEFDGRALGADDPWREAVVMLFSKVAAQLGAFYGAGYVERNVVVSRRRLWYSGDTESIFLSRMWWEGLPPHPTWLAWFGEPYRGMVESAVRESVTEERPEGLFLRLGENPMDSDEVKDVFPKLPDELLWTPRLPGKRKFDPSLPVERGEDPAAVLPRID